MIPNNIWLIRHGESEGNVDKSLYQLKPDYTMRLTRKGYNQALQAGKIISNGLQGPIAFYKSPFYRTRDTLEAIVKGGNLKNRMYKDYEDSRIREQEWSGRLRGFNNPAEEERDAYGHYFYRFEGGESCADVEDRVSSFLNTLWRDFEKEDFPDNVVIVTHGMTMRCFIKRWFKMSVENFESLKNPPNCHIYRIKRIGKGWGVEGGLDRWEERKCKYDYTPWNEYSH